MSVPMVSVFAVSVLFVAGLQVCPVLPPAGAEEEELDQYEYLAHRVRIAKAKAHPKLQAES